MKKEKVENDDIVGNLYIPDNYAHPIPGVILISGSDGGMPGENAIPESFISEIVSQGIAVLGLAYFGIGKLPNYLENIELEYFEKALRWFKLQPFIKNNSIGIIGQSRGGELALLLSTFFPKEIKAIIAYVPSNIVCGGFPYPNKPAWKYQGKPIVPFVGGLSSSAPNLTELEDLEISSSKGLISSHHNSENDPFIVSELFAARNLSKNSELAQIPVEKIECPLLIFSGGMDTIWTSHLYCQKIVERLNKYNSTIAYQHINYENAGHGIIASYDGAIYHPVGNFWCRLGGTPKGNQSAVKESLCEMLKFLKKYL